MKRFLLLIVVLLSYSYTNLFSQIMPINQLSENSLTICDQRYLIEMESVMSQISGTLNQQDTRTAQSYMVMLKQYQDLQFKLQYIERNIFNSDVISQLRTPLLRYSECLRNIDDRYKY